MPNFRLAKPFPTGRIFPLWWPPLGNEILSFIEGWPYLGGCICTKRVHLGLGKVASI